MKRIFLLFALALHALGAVSLQVSSTTNTALVGSFTNFFTANSSYLTASISNATLSKLDITNGTAVNLTGSLTNVTLNGSNLGTMLTSLGQPLPALAATNLTSYGNLLDLAVGFTPPSTSLKVFWDATNGIYNINRRATNSTYSLSSPGATYYLSPSGNDANAGTNAASPKRSIANLIDALNASPPSGGARIYLEGGLYSAGDSWNVRNITFASEWIGTNGYAYIPSGRAGSEFALAGGAVYVRYTHDVVGVVSWSSRDAYGAPYKFVLDGSSYADEAAVIAGLPAGYYYELGGATYIRMLDDSEPGDDTLTITPNSPTLHSIGSKNVAFYLRNIRMTGHGGGILYESTNTNATTMAAYAVEVAGNNSTTEDLFEIIVDSGFVFLDTCRADHGLKDGFNYHQGVVRDGGWFLEYDCSATGNGSDQSSNGSTAHEEVIGIRVNGYYAHNYGRNQHDIQDAQIVNINCRAGLSQLTGIDQDVGFNAAQEGLDTGPTQMWLINCASLGGGSNNRGYSASGTSTMHFIGTTGTETLANVYRATNAKIVRWGQPAGQAANLNVGTTAGTVAAGDDSRLVAVATKLSAADNLSDLTSPTAARTNLGLFASASSTWVVVSNTVTETDLLNTTLPANYRSDDGSAVDVFIPGKWFNQTGATATVVINTYLDGVKVTGDTSFTVSSQSVARPLRYRARVYRATATTANVETEFGIGPVGSGSTGVGDYTSGLAGLSFLNAEAAACDWTNGPQIRVTATLSSATTTLWLAGFGHEVK